MRCGVTTSYLCYINLIDGIEIFSSKNRGILIFRPLIKWLVNAILLTKSRLISMANWGILLTNSNISG